jgi:hypothetical protein
MIICVENKEYWEVGEENYMRVGILKICLPRKEIAARLGS